jgi:putative DNA primase/helicase
MMIDFAAIKAQAMANLPALLAGWLPDGRLHGREFVALNPRRHDRHAGSFRINILTGKWADFAITDASGGDPISLVAYLDGTTQPEAARRISEFLGLGGTAGAIGTLTPIAAEAGALARSNPRPAITPIVPVPADAPPLRYRHRQYGDPSGRWSYHLADGSLACYVVRFDFLKDGDQRKEFHPIAYCSVVDGNREYRAWQACGIPAPRPLYRLPSLLVGVAKPLLVVEGERSADVAAQRFPDYAVTTTMGGSCAPRRTDCSPMKGRDVVIWPDNDAPGQNYAAAVAVLALDAGAASVRVVAVPASFPPKWDLGDRLPCGVTDHDLRLLLRGATAPAADWVRQ